MVARNYSFRVSDKIKLMEAFEYQMERIKKFYSNEKTKVSQIEELEKYGLFPPRLSWLLQ